MAGHKRNDTGEMRIERSEGQAARLHRIIAGDTFRQTELTSTTLNQTDHDSKQNCKNKNFMVLISVITGTLTHWSEAL